MTVIEQIKRNLHGYKRKLYLTSLIKGLIYFVAFITSSVLIVSSVEYLAHFNSFVRTALFFAFLTASAYLAYKWLFKPIKQLNNIDSALSDEDAAVQIGKYFPEVSDKLLNTLQLSSISYGQGSLVAASIEQKAKNIYTIPFTGAVDEDENKKNALRYLVLPLALLLITFIGYRNIFIEGTGRIVQFQKEFLPAAPYEFIVQEPSLTALYKSNHEIVVATQGSVVPNQLYINIDGNRFPTKKIEKGIFSYTMNGVSAEHDFFFVEGEFQSKEYHLDLKYKPLITKILAHVSYPSYIGKNNEEIINTTKYSVPVGSEIIWNIETKHTSLFEADSSITISQKSKGNYQLSSLVLNSSKVTLLAKNEKDQTQAVSILDIETIPDEFPIISSNHHFDTLYYNSVMLAGKINDDYGFSKLQVVYEAFNEEGQKKSNGSIPIALNQQQVDQSYFHQLNLKQLKLKPGDKISVEVSVWDNDAINGPKKATSNAISLQIPSKQELDEELDQVADNTNNKINKSLTKSENIKEQISKLQDNLKTKNEFNWEDKKDLEKLLNKQKDLEKEVEKMKNEFEQYQNKFEEFNEQDEEIQKKAEKLKQLMENIIDEEMQELMRDLEKMMQEKMDEKELMKKLEDLEFKNEDVLNELDKSIEMFKQLQFDQKLESIQEDLEELAEQQEELAEETKEGNTESEELKNKQEKLNEEFKDLQKDLKELEKINEDLENQHDLEDLEQEQSDISKDQQESSEQLEKNNKKKASDSQQDAADKMKAMQKQLAQMQQSMQMQAMQENMDDLRTILENLVILSFDQESLMGEFKKVNQRDPRFVEMSQKQLKLQDDSKVIEDSLLALSKRVDQIESFVTRELTDMKRYMGESVTSIKERKPRNASGKQQKAMTSMNNLALMLSDVLKQMQEQMAEQMPGNQMCNKPGNSSKPGMGDMQKQISEMMKQMKNGQMSGRELSEQLAKMAARQEMIRRALQEMENGKEGMKPGDKMSELLKMMEDNERDIINNRITNKTVERQKEIETRLLDYEKAEREREFNNKRKSETALQKERIHPPGLEDFLRLKQKQLELLKTIPPNLTPYYKKEVNEYFQSIEK